MPSILLLIAFTTFGSHMSVISHQVDWPECAVGVKTKMTYILDTVLVSDISVYTRMFSIMSKYLFVMLFEGNIQLGD